MVATFPVIYNDDIKEMTITDPKTGKLAFGARFLPGQPVQLDTRLGDFGYERVNRWVWFFDDAGHFCQAASVRKVPA